MPQSMPLLFKVKHSQHEGDTLAKSKIDALIDHAEETNKAIRDLTFAILRVPIKGLPLPPQAKAVLPLAEQINEAGMQAYFATLRGGVDAIRSPRGQESLDILQEMPISGPITAVAPKPRSKKQKAYAKKQSSAFKEANKKLRTQAGKLRKGKTQSDVAKLAQKILKKSMIGKSTRKGQVRKTARRAYEGLRRK